jgi:hypothetical protein
LENGEEKEKKLKHTHAEKKSYLFIRRQKRMLCAIAGGNAKRQTKEKTRANDFVAYIFSYFLNV